eukprot:5842553-Alexandrium_andersonii.AAC.1
MHACNAALLECAIAQCPAPSDRRQRNDPPGSLDRPAREQLRAADGEHDPAERAHEVPVEE